MLIKCLKDCKEFIAGDSSILHELLHPDKFDLQIRYSLAHAKVLPGQATKPHKLRTSEVYYIIKGYGLMHIDKEVRKVGSGCAVYIPPESVQYIENIDKSDLIFICIVDPAWRKEDEYVYDSP
jgi:mannose-6-phosphate isomerase-like protein (cupin superfamily)